MSEWNEFNGSKEQITEINSCKKFQLLRIDGMESYILTTPFDPCPVEIETTKGYKIIEQEGE